MCEELFTIAVSNLEGTIQHPYGVDHVVRQQNAEQREAKWKSKALVFRTFGRLRRRWSYW